jgi:Tfp pilus assembly protein PilO
MLFREKRQIAICAVAVAMVAGFVLFRYLPLRKRIKAVRHKRAVQTLAAANVWQQSRQLPVLKEQLLKLQMAVGNHEEHIPAQKALGVFMRRIANLMNEHQLKEQEIAPGKEIEVDELNCIPVNMQCKGRLKQIFEFHRRMQGLDRLVRIEQVKLVNDNNFSGEVSMQTRAFIYYKAQAEQG